MAKDISGIVILSIAGLILGNLFFGATGAVVGFVAGLVGGFFVSR